MRTYLKLFNQGQHCQNFIILQCTPPPLLRRKTSSFWPPMAIPLALLPPDLASASPQYPEHSETSISISITPLGVVLPSFLLPLKEQFLLKSPLARLPILWRPSTISTPSFLHPSPQKQWEESSEKIHSRLWWRRKSPCWVQGIGRGGWHLLWSIGTGLWRTGRELFGQMKHQQVWVRWKAVGLETEERGVDSEGGAENSWVWWRKYYGMGVYRVEWSGASCRGQGKDGCWSVCGYFGEAHAV